MTVADLLLSVLADFPFYALLALSFLISFRMHAFPDLAMDASYALGMALLVAVLRTHLGLPLLVAALIAVPSGFAVGATTAALHGLRWPSLSKFLAGLVVSFAMFSVNFRVNGETTTTGLYGSPHELNLLRDWLSAHGIGSSRLWTILVAVGLLCIVVAAVYFLLRRGLGVQLRIGGYRPDLITEAGGRPIVFTALALGIANAIAALAGCFRAGTDNYADINTFGTFLFALASLLLGERAVGLTTWGQRNAHRFVVQLLAPILGGLLMSLLVQLSILLLSSSLNVYLSSDIRLVVALVLIFASAGVGRRGRGKGMFDG